jgi:hypothetical protein
MNEAQQLMGSLGAKSIEQRRAELAGAITRMVYNQAVAEAKQRAAVRDANLAPTPSTGEQPSQNG